MVLVSRRGVYTGLQSYLPREKPCALRKLSTVYIFGVSPRTSRLASWTPFRMPVPCPHTYILLSGKITSFRRETHPLKWKYGKASYKC